MRKAILVVTIAAFLAPATVIAAEKYTVDGAHTTVGFSVKHLGVTTVRGKFKDFAIDLMVDEADMTKSTASVTIQAASVTTDNENRDGHMKTDDFFNVEKFPTITFVSKKIEKKDDMYLITGDLTLRDVTKEVVFATNVAGPMPGGRGGKKIAMSAETTINRQDYGVKWNRAMDNGGVVVSDSVKIEVEGEFVVPGPEKK